MSGEDGHAHALPSWFVPPGDADVLAWVSLGMIFVALYGVVTLYASFDRWAEHSSQGTPLARTIPTMLTIALLYEIFPLGHFNILLPLSAILIALMADWSRFHLNTRAESVADEPVVVAPPQPVPDPEPKPDPAAAETPAQDSIEPPTRPQAMEDDKNA